MAVITLATTSCSRALLLLLHDEQMIYTVPGSARKIMANSRHSNRQVSVAVDTLVAMIKERSHARVDLIYVG
jgi:hypothetical protein